MRLLTRCLSCWSHEHAVYLAQLTFPTWQRGFKLSASFPLRDVTNEIKKKKEKTTLGKGQSLNPQTFSSGSACFRFETTCGMFALRRSAAALRLWRTVLNYFHHIRIPAQVTRFTFTSSQNTSSRSQSWEMCIKINIKEQKVRIFILE